MAKKGGAPVHIVTGAALRSFRVSKGLTQTQFAHKLGCSRMKVFYVEKSASEISPADARRMEDGFGKNWKEQVVAASMPSSSEKFQARIEMLLIAIESRLSELEASADIRKALHPKHKTPNN